MGNEFLVLFIPVPIIFWIWNVWQISRISTRIKGIALLLLGISFIGFMCWPFATKQYILQGFAIGGFLYAPVYLAAWIVVTIAIKKANEKNGKKLPA